MNDVERLLAERECEKLIIAYTEMVDSGHAARVPELFTEDGIWESDELRMEGRTQLERGFRRRQDMDRRSRHVCTNISVELVDDHEANGQCYLVLFNADGVPDDQLAPLAGPRAVGEYVDRFRRTQDGWRFVHRRSNIAFMAQERGDDS